MQNNSNILSLLGLALRGNRLVVGDEVVEAAARAKDARLLLLASDASEHTCRRCRHFAEAGACIALTLPFTKEELGRATGHSAVAIAALTDVGLAATVARRLADLDSAQYGEAAERMELKAKRAAARRAEMEAHKKNLRQGKCRHAKAEKAPEQPPVKQADQKPERKSFEKGGRSDRPNRGKHGSRPSKGNRPQARVNRYAHSRPVKKGKGSFRKREQ